MNKYLFCLFVAIPLLGSSCVAEAQQWQPNATVVIEDPQFGVMSARPEKICLFCNDMRIRKEGYFLQKGARVKLLPDNYFTFFMRWHYGRIEFIRNNQIATGWVRIGKPGERWYWIVPDDINSPYSLQLDKTSFITSIAQAIFFLTSNAYASESEDQVSNKKEPALKIQSDMGTSGEKQVVLSHPTLENTPVKITGQPTEQEINITEFSYRASFGAIFGFMLGALVYAVQLLQRRPGGLAELGNNINWAFRLLILIAVVPIVMSITHAFLFSLALGAICGIGLEAALISPLGNIRNKELRGQVTQAEKQVENNPGRIKPLWDLARKDLELYIEHNLVQVRYIFWISVITMIVGFCLIGWGVYTSLQGTPSDFKAALFATVSGVLTEFIGATFLFVYRTATSQATDFVKMLERIHSIGISVQIVDSCEADESGQEGVSKAKLVSQLLTELRMNRSQ